MGVSQHSYWFINLFLRIRNSIRSSIMGNSMAIEFHRGHQVRSEYMPSSSKTRSSNPTQPLISSNGQFLKFWPFKRSFFSFLIISNNHLYIQHFSIPFFTIHSLLNSKSSSTFSILYFLLLISSFMPIFYNKFLITITLMV